MGFSRGLTLLSLATSALLSSAKFLEFKTQADDCSKLEIELPTSSLKKSFITHAIFNKATLVEGKIPDLELTRSWWVEDRDHMTFHFDVSEDGKYLHYIREQYDVRTSDPEMQYALKEGTWTGYNLKLPIVKTENDLITIRAEELVTQGFGITDDDYLSREYEIVMKETNSFEKNANIVINYQAKTTYNVLISLMELPEVPMKTREADDRIGYFAQTYTDLGVHAGAFDSKSRHQAKQIDSVHTIISRRRLEKDENGKVVKPISFYVDHSVPEIWRPYVKKGIETWKVAFEKAGFPEAIRAVLPGDADWPSDYHVGDFRFNTISFSVFTGDGPTAVGPSFIDPRSGEILLTNIVFSSNWPEWWMKDLEMDSIENPFPNTKHHLFHHRGSCSHHKMKQGAEQFNIAKMTSGFQLADDSVSKNLVGRAFMDTTAHEVGHTLGLRHNFEGSTAFSPEQLKDTEFTKKNGIANTYMDYLPLNVWTDMTAEQIHDNTWYQEQIGEYDFAAIEYGYKELEGEVNGVKHPELFKIAEKAPAFSTDAERRSEMGPFTVAYDLSSDPAAYRIDQIAMVKELRKHVFDRSVAENDSWVHAFNMEKRWLSALINSATGLGLYLGGVKIDKAHRAPGHSAENAVEYIGKEKQLEAIKNILRIISGEPGLTPAPEDFHLYVDRMEKDNVYAVRPAEMDRIVNVVKNYAITSLVNEKAFKRIVAKGSGATLSVSSILDMASKTIIPLVSDSSNLPTVMNYIGAIAALRKSSDARISASADYALAMIKQMLNQPKQLRRNTNTVAVFAINKKLDELLA